MMLIKTEAIVLKKKELLNADFLFTLFTDCLGKINAVAKGVRKITSKRLSHLQTGNLINILIRKNKDFFYIEETNLISGFSMIKKNQKKIQALYYYFFIIEKLLPENQKEEEVYRQFKLFLVTLAKEEKNIRQLLENYLNILMKQLGYLKEDQSLNKITSLVEDLINEKIPSFHI